MFFGHCFQKLFFCTMLIYPFRSLYDGDRAEQDSSPEMVEQLRKQLREKDMVLTDIRLEALSSAHQLESLKDTVIKMRVCNI